MLLAQGEINLERKNNRFNKMEDITVYVTDIMYIYYVSFRALRNVGERWREKTSRANVSEYLNENVDF